MPSAKDFIDSLNTKSEYENFSEEVEILAVTSTGNMALYTVKNKNGVTFQNVPGLVGLESRGYLGFVRGDRARPIMISGLASSEVTTTDIGSTGLVNIPGIDISPTMSWDIQLTAISAVGNSTAAITTMITI